MFAGDTRCHIVELIKRSKDWISGDWRTRIEAINRRAVHW
jgi:hypothetical protein